MRRRLAWSLAALLSTAPSVGANAAPARPATGPFDGALVLREWRKAENRAHCAPLAFTSLAGRVGTARRAVFSGGWAIAYDQPGLRSAFGIAGSGLIGEDEAPPEAQRARLSAQWPLFREIPNLPVPAFAGYGLEGAQAYTAANPDGRGVNSLAYLRVGGQRCTYNVWSRLGRAHLEHLLEHLRLVPH